MDEKPDSLLLIRCSLSCALAMVAAAKQRSLRGALFSAEFLTFSLTFNFFQTFKDFGIDLSCACLVYVSYHGKIQTSRRTTPVRYSQKLAPARPRAEISVWNNTQRIQDCTFKRCTILISSYYYLSSISRYLLFFDELLTRRPYLAWWTGQNDVLSFGHIYISICPFLVFRVFLYRLVTRV